MLLSFML